MNDQVRRGRLRLLIQSLAVLALSGMVIVLTLSRLPVPLDSPGGHTAILTRAVRFLLTALLLLMVYRGSNVAKWIAVILFGLAIAMSLPFITVPIMATMAVFYGTYLFLLLASKDVAAFLQYQRSHS